ncbi:MAG: alpha/beta hydrolase family protein [Thermoplasmata archaeon]
MPELRVDDLYRMHFIGNLNVTGSRVFFEVFTPSEKKNGYDSQIMELRGKHVVRFTRGSEDRNSAFDLRGDFMAYLTKEGEKTAVVTKNLATGEERKLWETEMKIKEMVWDRRSSGLYLIAKDKVKEEDYKVFERYPIYFNGQGFYPFSGYKLLHLGLSGRVRKLKEGEDEISGLAVNPREDVIALIVKPEGWDVYDSKIQIMSAASGEVKDVEGVVGGVDNVAYDEEGNLYFLFSRHERSVFESKKLFRYGDSGLENVSRDFDISIGNSLNSDSRMGVRRSLKATSNGVYFIATISGRAGIYRIRKKKLEKVVSGDFSVDTFDLMNEDVFFVSQSISSPPELYIFDGKVRKATSLNSYIAKRITAKPLNFRMRASDGKAIEGWYLKGRKRGAILEIHGGPRTAYGEAFMFEFHLLNSQGFNVIFSNPRGSDSYGDDFALEIKGNYGDRDFKDIMEVADYAVKKLGVDGERIGVIGGSYGGFMVNWIIGHTARFKAAVTDRSISDQISFYFSSDIGPRFNSDQMGGDPYSNLEHYWDKSPLKYMRNVKTPLLIVHSEEDYRCPIWQAYEMFTQLKRQGSRVRMIEFKGENHDLSREGKPKNRVRRLTEIVNWFSGNL